MKIDSAAVPTSKRIVGTLHLRDDTNSAPSGGEKPPWESDAEGEVEGQQKSSQNDKGELR